MMIHKQTLLTRMISSVGAISLALMFSASSLWAAGNFDDCGSLRLTNDGCLVFAPDHHPGIYSLDNYFGFGAGDRVHVTGRHDSNYFCGCSSRCIRQNTITEGCSTLCSSVQNDVNNDGRINVSDIVALISYIFLGGEAIECLEQGDCNSNGRIEISDVVCLIDVIF